MPLLQTKIPKISHATQRFPAFRDRLKVPDRALWDSQNFYKESKIIYLHALENYTSALYLENSKATIDSMVVNLKVKGQSDVHTFFVC